MFCDSLIHPLTHITLTTQLDDDASVEQFKRVYVVCVCGSSFFALLVPHVLD